MCAARILRLKNWATPAGCAVHGGGLGGRLRTAEPAVARAQGAEDGEAEGRGRGRAVAGRAG